MKYKIGEKVRIVNDTSVAEPYRGELAIIDDMHTHSECEEEHRVIISTLDKKLNGARARSDQIEKFSSQLNLFEV